MTEKCNCGKPVYKIDLCKEHFQDAKKLVLARLDTMPENISIHVGLQEKTQRLKNEANGL